jgi:tetratricopeptide (TPR) repeat protein/DNA-binding CsgD family transcriptional regulator
LFKNSTYFSVMMKFFILVTCLFLVALKLNASDDCGTLEDDLDRAKKLYQKGKKEQASNLFLTILERSRSCNNDEWTAKSLYSLGIVSNDLGNSISATTYFSQIEELEYVRKHPEFIAMTHTEWASSFKEEFPEKALDHLIIAEKIQLKLKDTSSLIYTYSSMADLYLRKLNSIDKALKLLHFIDLHPNHIENKQLLVANVGLLAFAYYQQNDSVLAKLNYEKCLVLSDSFQFTPFQSNCHYYLAMLDEGKKDYENAYHHFRAYNRLKDSIFQLDQRKIIFDIQNEYEKKIQIKENEILKDKNAITFYGALGIILSLFAIGLIIWFKHRKKQAYAQWKLEENSRAIVSHELHLSKTRKLIDNLSDGLETLKSKRISAIDEELTSISRQIKFAFNTEEEWNSFILHFEGVHPNFFEKLLAIHPSLNQEDQKFCAYIKMNLTTKDLTQMLNVSDRTIQSKRYRLKKKLELSSDSDLIQYIQQL